MDKGVLAEKNILITGAHGFIGKNLCARLGALGCENLMLYDKNSNEQELEAYARKADFVFHLAGVNRPEKADEFYSGNVDLTQRLLGLLEKNDKKTPVLITSSAQAGNGSDYGTSKLQAEKVILSYGEKTGTEVFVYRLPGVFGKWSRPNYNTVVATFCHNIARGLPIQINDENAEVSLVYIDDVVNAFIAAVCGMADVDPNNAGYCRVQPVYKATLGRIAKIIEGFKHSRNNLNVPFCADEFSRKLYACYLSFLPSDEFAYDLKMNTDERGSFTEFMRAGDKGQFSVNVSKAGIVKGNHWHDTKNEKFLVVSGEAIIRFRKVFEEEVFEYRVSGEEMRVVDIPTGYTHNIENVGSGELITLMWASEEFDPEKADTFFEKV